MYIFFCIQTEIGFFRNVLIKKKFTFDSNYFIAIIAIIAIIQWIYYFITQCLFDWIKSKLCSTLSTNDKRFKFIINWYQLPNKFLSLVKSYWCKEYLGNGIKNVKNMRIKATISENIEPINWMRAEKCVYILVIKN